MTYMSENYYQARPKPKSSRVPAPPVILDVTSTSTPAEAPFAAVARAAMAPVDTLLMEMEAEHLAEAYIAEELTSLAVRSRRRVLVRVLELVTSGRLDIGLNEAPAAQILMTQAVQDWKS